ncbi:hypothetical protein ACA910_006484 [Epithemia clementina (nom. ined.)]
MTKISASEAVLLVARGEQIHADPNFQGSRCNTIRMAYKESQANKDFFQNLDLDPTHQPIPPNFFDSINNYTIDNTTIDTNSVNHLLDTTLDTAEITGDNTNSSFSVNRMSMDATLHLKYIPTDTEDGACKDEDHDEDNSSKTKSTPSSLVDLS